MDIYQLIGSRIRRAREALGYSQEELGRQLGYSAAAISYFEAGMRKVRIDDLQRIARVLGKPLDFFLQEEPETEKIAMLARAREEVCPKAYDEIQSFLRHLDKEGITGELKIDLSGFRPYAAAEQLLQSQGIDRPPVPVQDVSQNAGIPVVDWEFDDGISAVLIRGRSSIVIGVNQHHPEPRRRFSIAHELGHAVLGHAERMYIEFVAADLLPERDRKRQEDEHEANWFAADLLMPINWVREDWKRSKGNVSEMAKRYGVSEQAMWIRLQQFHLAPLS